MPKRILQGRVTSDKNEQTITVLVERRFKHPLLHKTVRFLRHRLDGQGSAAAAIKTVTAALE